MKKSVFSRFKLLHAVIVVGFTLLVFEGAGILRDAQAQEAGAATVAQNTAADTGTQTTRASSDPAADDSENTDASEMDVLTGLAKRRAELDAREADLNTRENLLEAAEQRVDAKITELKQLQAQMQQLLGQRDAAQQKQIESLVKTYSSMKPKDAARIFNTLNDDVRLSVAQSMKPDVLALIMAQMDSDAAKTVTVELAKRLTLPSEENIPAAQPSQAAATPIPQPVDGTQATPASADANSQNPATAQAAAAPAPTADSASTSTQPPAQVQATPAPAQAVAPPAAQGTPAK